MLKYRLPREGKQLEFRDLKTQYQRLKPEIDAAIEQALSSARFIQGQQVGELEEQLRWRQALRQLRQRHGRADAGPDGARCGAG